MADGPYRHAFQVVTSPDPANSGEFRDVARAVGAVDTLEALLRDMRARYPETGSITPVDAGFRPGPQSRERGAGCNRAAGRCCPRNRTASAG